MSAPTTVPPPLPKPAHHPWTRPRVRPRAETRHNPSSAGRPRQEDGARLPVRRSSGYFPPNWFAAAMGTGIVATAAATLPVQVPGQRTFATTVWVADAVLLAVLLTATAVHWVRHPQQARAHISHPVISHFYGAPPMAMLTVGAGALLVGRDVVGAHTAVLIDAVLWVAGTLTGLISAVVVPYYAFTRHRYEPASPFGGWLMPIVPPMVSASTGALLVPHTAPGQWRTTLLLGCYSLFGFSLLASLVIITLIWGRLMQHKVGAAAAVPTLWIVLGPLGQSITAAGLLSKAAAGVLPATEVQATNGFALLYGLGTWGFAVLWFAVATALTLRTLRSGLPFSLTWWSFTFPVGTVVTGTSGLAARTGLHLFTVTAAGLYVVLLLAWLLVATRTARGALNGTLLVPA
ncbi:TDT family transporter [Kineococcus sp. GCM10028916]|uniref:TDT family transporter n=1 Tax=Kineococcus sp. GCM10028916 TaxID=3273394 RepID=UPI003640CB0D